MGRGRHAALGTELPVLEKKERTNLLEIGSFEGLSTAYFLWRLPNARVTSIDTFAGSQEHQSESVDTSQLEAVFEANVRWWSATRVRKLVGDSKRVPARPDPIEGSAFDLIYVDGSHLGLDVLVDAALSLGVCSSNGWLPRLRRLSVAKLGKTPPYDQGLPWMCSEPGRCPVRARLPSTTSSLSSRTRLTALFESAEHGSD